MPSDRIPRGHKFYDNAKTGERIAIEFLRGHEYPYWVMFCDLNGRSVLAKVQTPKEARERAKYFTKEATEDRLLSPDASAYNY